MVKQKSELKQIGNTKPSSTHLKKADERLPDMFISLDGKAYSTPDEAWNRDEEIRAKIKSDQTQLGPDEIRKLLKR